MQVLVFNFVKLIKTFENNLSKLCNSFIFLHLTHKDIANCLTKFFCRNEYQVQIMKYRVFPCNGYLTRKKVLNDQGEGR